MKSIKSNHLVNFFKNKTVLITGNKGFIGTWLSLWLCELNCNVIGITKSKNCSKVFHESIKKHLKIKQLYCDVTNKDELNKIISKYTPDYIFDLSGQPIVNKSFQNPYETLKDNILGSLNFMEICRKNNINTTLVSVSTENVFYDAKKYQKSKAVSPYLTSKLTKELILSCYNSNYFNKNTSNTEVICLKPSNIFGGGDFAEDRLVSGYINSKINHTQFIIKKPNEKRPWIYIHDFCYETLMFLTKKKNTKKAFPNIKFSANTFLNAKITSSIETEFNILTANNSKKKAKKLSNNVSQKLIDTIEWYLVGNKNHKELYLTSSNQIKKYLSH